MGALKDRRKQLGLSLRDVEQITDGRISNAYLSQLENGKIKDPSVTVAVSLASAYALPVNMIVEWLSSTTPMPQVTICEACGQVIK